MTHADVEHIAKLAKLEFSATEKDLLVDQLSQIISYFEKLSELDTESVEPTYHVVPLTNRFREDKAETWLDQKEALRNAPSQRLGFFCVPKVVSND